MRTERTRLKLLIVFFTIFAIANCGSGSTDTGGTTPQTDAEAVAADKTALTITYGGSDSASSVTQNVTLSASGSSGTTITWGSDTLSVIAIDGTVTRPAYGSSNATVVLTATIDKNGTNDTKQFTLTVTQTPPNVGDSVSYTAGVSFKMVYVPGGYSFKTDTADSGTDSVADAYLIGETEVTYELWNAVHTWATSNSYTFANAGVQGKDGSGSTTPQHPVTTINWRDAMVWTNALTEYYNAQNSASLVAVYYSDSGYTVLLKNSSDGTCGSAVDTTPGQCDNPYVKAGANGFRLPTMAEWSLASRYKGSDSSNGAYEYPANSTNWWTPGTYASGATAAYTDATATNLVSVNFNNSGLLTAIVKSKTANALGLYDMSGNVLEWNFDWHPSYIGSYRLLRGGSWGNSAGSMQVGGWVINNPFDESYYIGFRLSRTP